MLMMNLTSFVKRSLHELMLMNYQASMLLFATQIYDSNRSMLLVLHHHRRRRHHLHHFLYTERWELELGLPSWPTWRNKVSCHKISPLRNEWTKDRPEMQVYVSDLIKIVLIHETQVPRSLIYRLVNTYRNIKWHEKNKIYKTTNSLLKNMVLRLYTSIITVTSILQSFMIMLTTR